jgi:hypothetical protein
VYSYEVDFYSSQQKRQWTYVPEEDEENKFHGAMFLGFTDSMMLLTVAEQKKVSSNKPNVHFVGVNLFTKRKVFDINNEKEDNPFLATNVLPVKGKNQMLVVGTYYNKGANITKDMSTGLVIYTLDNRGKVLNKTYNSWKVDMAGLAGNEMKDKKGNINNLIIHKIQQVGGKIFIIGEAYDPQTISDLVLLEVDNNNKLSKMTNFLKTPNKWGSIAPGIMSLERAAAYAKGTGNFDYQYTTNDDEGSFTVLYTDYPHKQGDKKAFTTLRYNGAKFKANKMDLNSKADEIRVYPAVPGSIMIIEYSKKEKRLDMRIERIS